MCELEIPGGIAMLKYDRGTLIVISTPNESVSKQVLHLCPAGRVANPQNSPVDPSSIPVRVLGIAVGWILGKNYMSAADLAFQKSHLARKD